LENVSQKKPPEKADQPAMPFDEALKRVWSAKPMPKAKVANAKQKPPRREKE
jgi:hypothetical protein